jgi:hypothetical protein
VPADVTFARASSGGDPAGPSSSSIWVPFVRGSVPPRFAGRTVDSFGSLVPPPAALKP